MKKKIIIIDRKTGKMTITSEGAGGGGACIEHTRKLEEGLGMKSPQREMTPEFYEKNDQDLANENKS